MNHLYCGFPGEPLNIGNGKTSSMIYEVLLMKKNNPEKEIYSNIQLHGVDYIPLQPDNLMEILHKKDCIVIFDEISAVIHKNHRITTTCKQHGDYVGLCYQLTQFVRQVRKRKIEAYFTAQSFLDVQKQIRDIIQRTVFCEKYGVVGSSIRKCTQDTCVPAHPHMIRQIDSLSGEEKYISIDQIYSFYDSNEIVEGWV